MEQKLLLITPPFTQLNTPYPATAYLKGFLNTKSITAFQLDLGIEVILDLFSKAGLTRLFQEINAKSGDFSENSKRILALLADYLFTIDTVFNSYKAKILRWHMPFVKINFYPKLVDSTNSTNWFEHLESWEIKTKRSI